MCSALQACAGQAGNTVMALADIFSLSHPHQPLSSLHSGMKHRVGDLHKILATGGSCPRRGQQTQRLPSAYEWPVPLMRKETNLINTGPFLLETYITGEPQMLSFQITLEI